MKLDSDDLHTLMTQTLELSCVRVSNY